MKNWLIGKDPDAGKDWRQEEKGMTEDETVGWHHWLDGHEFEQALGDGDGQEAWCSAVHGLAKSRPRLSDGTGLFYNVVFVSAVQQSDSVTHTHIPSVLNTHTYTHTHTHTHTHMHIPLLGFLPIGRGFKGWFTIIFLSLSLTLTKNLCLFVHSKEDIRNQSKRVLG